MFNFRKRFRVVKLFGVPLYVELSFLLLAVFYLLMGGRSSIFGTLIWIAVVTASIVWHELGHAFAARHFGSRKNSIVLHGAGGLTFHEPMRKLQHSIIVSAAGPAFGLLLGVPFLVGQQIFGELPIPLLAVTARAIIWVNIVWSLFNLLPMLPLDGGNILYHWLLLRMQPRRALEISLALAFYLAVAIGIVAMVQQMVLLVLICFFCGQMAWVRMGGPEPLKRFWANVTAGRGPRRR